MRSSPSRLTQLHCRILAAVEAAAVEEVAAVEAMVVAAMVVVVVDVMAAAKNLARNDGHSDR